MNSQFIEILNNKSYKLDVIPDYGDKMTIDEWRKSVKNGYLIDYDGFGELATETQTSDMIIKPSHEKYINWFKVKQHFSHVIWFNR